MATYVLTIAGSAKVPKLGSMFISAPQNGIDRFDCDIISLDKTYRPAIGAEVILTEDGTRIFGGHVHSATEVGVAEGAAGTGIITRISCSDFTNYADRRYVNEDRPSETLAARLGFLVTTYLAAYGVTLSGSQATGITLEAATYDYVKLTELLNELSTLTGWVWEINYSKVLRMYAPGTLTAPFDVIGNSGNNAIGDIEIEPTRDDLYANRVIVLVAPVTEIRHRDEFPGTGAQTIFPLNFTPVPAPPGEDQVPNGGVVWYHDPALGYDVAETMGFIIDTTPVWVYDPATNTITDQGDVPGETVTDYRASPIATGTSIYIFYDGSFSATVQADDAGEQAANGIWEVVIRTSTALTVAQAQALADAELVKRVAQQKVIRYQTDQPGLFPGMTQTINVSDRSINVTALISEVTTRDIGRKDSLLRRSVTALASGIPQEDWRKTIKDWSVVGTSGGEAPSVTAANIVGPAPPNRSGQFNNEGVFAGTPDFLIDWNGSGDLYGVDTAAGRVAIGASGTSIDASKLYLSFDLTPTFTPSLKGDWDDTASVVTRRGLLNPVSTGNATLSSVYVIENGASPVDLLHLQIVSDPLAAQTISGTVDVMILAAQQPWPDFNGCWHLHIYATIGDTDGVRCTLLNDYRENDPNVLYNSGLANFSSFTTGFVRGDKLFTPATLTSGAILSGDRIVVEIGCIARNTYSGFSPGLRIQYGENVADADSAFEDVGTIAGGGGANNGFIQFSNPIALVDATSAVQLAVFNQTAGKANALTVQQINDGSNYIKAAGTITWTIDNFYVLVSTGLYVNGVGVLTSLTGDVTATGPGAGAATIASNAVSYAKMQDITAASRLIGRGSAAGAGDPQEITLGSGLSMTGTVLDSTGGSGITALTGDVTATGPGSVAATIANDAVTYAKIQNISAASKLLGRGSAGGAGDTEEIALGTNLSMSGTTLNSSGAGTGSGYLVSGSGHPQGSETANAGTVYVDTGSGIRYAKIAGSGNTGWYPILEKGPILASQLSEFGWRAAPPGNTLAGDGFPLTADAISLTGFSGTTLSAHRAADAYYMKAATGTAAGNNGGFYDTYFATSRFQWDLYDFDIAFKIRTDASALTDVRYWAGLVVTDPTNSNTLPARSVAIRYADGTDTQWVGVTHDGTTQNVTGNIAAIAANTAYTLRIRKVSGTVYFSVNDGTEVSTSTNVPTGSTNPYLIVLSTVIAGGTSRSIEMSRLGGTWGT